MVFQVLLADIVYELHESPTPWKGRMEKKKARKKPVDPEIAEWEAGWEERYKLIIRYLKRREAELRERLDAQP